MCPSLPCTCPLTSSQAPMSKSRSSKMGLILPSAVGPTLRSRLLQGVGVGTSGGCGWGKTGPTHPLHATVETSW